MEFGAFPRPRRTSRGDELLTMGAAQFIHPRMPHHDAVVDAEALERQALAA
jgi:hypothetical protein